MFTKLPGAYVSDSFRVVMFFIASSGSKRRKLSAPPQRKWIEVATHLLLLVPHLTT
jgi:hypothetical protein